MRERNGAGGDAVFIWIARVVVASVLALNLGCAASFILQPFRYVSGFELSGVPGKVMVQGLGILFLMWNATYPPVILRPDVHRTLFGVVLVQQAVGLAGETWLWLTLPSGHSMLSNTGLRFIIFDGIGLVLIATTYVLLPGTWRRWSRRGA